MPQSVTIQQELQELNSSLAVMPPGNAYAVPAGYFESLAATVLQRIKAMEATTVSEEIAHLSPLLASLSKESPYRVPADYFSSLDPSFVFYEDEDVNEELNRLSPLLGGLSKEAPFSLPEGYFQKPLPETVKKPEAPVVRMAPRKWFKYAIAASVATVITLGVIFWNNQASTPGAAGQPYAWVEKNMKKVSTEDISKFVDLADQATPDLAKASASADIKGLLKNVSDKEIQEFLKDVPDESEDDDILFN
ncbi:MAG: hypothetical protein EOO01_19645 [Chitinophagaceae bacterium]|nr:MAG: hypothetical protein EOO01_19645 [Chitinophagaceae bacterium]